MRYPQHPTNPDWIVTVWDGVTRCVLWLEADRDGRLHTGALFREVSARGKAPTYRRVPTEGPTYQRILNSARGLSEIIADKQPDPEQPGN